MFQQRIEKQVAASAKDAPVYLNATRSHEAARNMECSRSLLERNEFKGERMNMSRDNSLEVGALRVIEGSHHRIEHAVKSMLVETVGRAPAWLRPKLNNGSHGLASRMQ